MKHPRSHFHGSKPAQRLAWRLRCIADRIDPEHAPRASEWGWTFEPHVGAAFWKDRGCRIWSLNEPQREAAYADSLLPWDFSVPKAEAVRRLVEAGAYVQTNPLTFGCESAHNTP